MDDIMKIVQFPWESCSLTKRVYFNFNFKTIENEEKKSGFLGTLLGTLGASLLENILVGKKVVRSGEESIRGRQDL